MSDCTSGNRNHATFLSVTSRSMPATPMACLLALLVLAPAAHAEQAGSTSRTFVAGSIDGAASTSCALLANRAVRCWGSGSAGRTGHDSTANIGDGVGQTIQAAGDVPLGATATAIATGNRQGCALLTTGAVRCWGQGSFGVLGHDSTANIGDGVGQSIQAAGDIPLGGTAKAITGGGDHTCALMSTGAVRCWGGGPDGRLGQNDIMNIGDGVGDSIQIAGDVPLGGTATAISRGP